MKIKFKRNQILNDSNEIIGDYFSSHSYDKGKRFPTQKLWLFFIENKSYRIPACSIKSAKSKILEILESEK